MPSTVQDPQAPPGLEHKSASASPEGGLIEADDATGVVEAIVSVTGVLDEDRDVIKPGAYAKTLSRRKPKGIFVHDWGRWVARTEHVEELLPGDARLPKQTKDGKAWPSQAGGLYVRCRFNLETREGKDAYSNVKFFSETGEQEWSIGYKVPTGKSVRTKSGERHIEEVDLFEYSPVLFGANTMSGTLSVKSTPAGTTAAPDTEDETTDPEEGAEGAAEPEQRDADDDTSQEPEEPAGEEKDLTAEDLEELEEAADQVSEEDLEDPAEGPAESPDEVADEPSREDSGGEREGGGPDDPADPGPEGKALFDLTPPPLSNRLEVFHELRSLRVPDISDTAMRDRVHAALFRLDQALKRGELSQVEVELDFVLSQLRKIGNNPVIRSFTENALRILGAPGRTEPVGDGAWEHRKSASTKEEKGSRASLDRSPKKNWVENTGELPGYIREIARSIHEKRGMPLDRAIPIAIAQIKKWASGGGGVNADTKAKAAAALAAWEKLKVASHAKSGLPADAESKGWLERLHPRDRRGRFSESSSGGGLAPAAVDTPGAIRANPPDFSNPRGKILASSLKKGDVYEEFDELYAVVSTPQKDGDVVRFRYAPLSQDLLDEGESYGEEDEIAVKPNRRFNHVGTQASPGSKQLETLESTTYPYLPGTYEELREQLRQEATKALDSAGIAHVEVMGTWNDRVVVTAYQTDGKALSYEIGYTLTADGTALEELDEPVPVELKVSMEGEDDEEDGQGLLPYPSVIDEVTLDLKVLLGHGESKAGRVLSTINEKRLLAAVESLVAVLKAAGLEVDGNPRADQEKEEREQRLEAAQYQDTTAPSARAESGKARIDPALLARGYRVLGDVRAGGS